MKKLLLGTLVLLAFNAAIIITQMSCKKEAVAEPSPATTVKNINKVLIYRFEPRAAKGKVELKVLNYDGTVFASLSLAMPDGQEMYGARLSPDGEKIFYSTSAPGTVGATYLYSCDKNGGNSKLIYTETAGFSFDLYGAH